MQIGRHRLTHCRYGWMLHSGPYVGKCFELYGQYSEAEVQVFRAVIRAGDTCIDVGANIGDLTLPMAQIAGPAGRVYAFESNPEHCHALGANLTMNGIVNTKVHNNFVSDGEASHTAGRWGETAFVGETWAPEVVALDTLKLESCAFIKIDVDGHEYEVLCGASATIARCRPILYFENDEPAKSQRLLEHVLGLDYVIYFHAAPIFGADNFFGNPVNHWAPQDIVSLMMLALPKEHPGAAAPALRRVAHSSDTW